MMKNDTIISPSFFHHSFSFPMHPLEVLFLQYIYITYGDITVDYFAQVFGVHISTAILLFITAVTSNDMVQPLWVLQFLYWIKHYPTGIQATFTWKCDEKTWRSHIYQVLFALYSHLSTVCIFFPSFLFLFFFLISYFLFLSLIFCSFLIFYPLTHTFSLFFSIILSHLYFSFSYIYFIT